ncbi:MAG: alpha/beta fold hydrolase [Acidobacteria bacterium]|nr:alpha/beta fold hydrolase [Acidobacteriota bacterium]
MSSRIGNYTRTDSDFVSRGTRCAGWLYIPDGVAAPPAVIMAHGFGAERTFRLPAYAARLAEAGYAVFLFDYRCFGASDGRPRQLVSPSRHVQDWLAAIDHVRALREVDGERIALWGTSFSGGHVIAAAAKGAPVRAIVAQVPYVDPFSTFSRLGLTHILRSLIAALRDAVRLLTSRPPYYVPIVGEPGTLACMNTPDSKPGYLALVPPDSSWKNECPARILFTVSFYRPLGLSARVKCPALLMAAEKDSLISLEAVERTAARIQGAVIVRLPVGHFDVYWGGAFEDTIRIGSDFLKAQMRAGMIMV